MGGGTKQDCRETLVSMVVFQISGLSVTAYMSLSVSNDPDSCPFQMAMNYFTNQNPDLTQLGTAKSGSHHTQGPGTT